MRYLIGVLLLASPAMAGEPAYSWRSNADDPDRIYLYLDGKQVGGGCYSGKHYRSFDGKEWGPPTAAAPTRPPANRVIVTPTVPRPMAMVQPTTAVPKLRGPLRRRAATVFSEAIVEGAMRVIEEIPGAILDSILKGNAKWSFEGSVKRP